MIVSRGLQLQTKGHTDIQNITPQALQAVRESQVKDGLLTIFCPGSTGGITTIEFESGVVADLKQILDEIAPPDRDYLHHRRWGDDNGSSHVRAALVGPSLTVPIINGNLALGTWQQIVFLDFDTSPRSRELILQILGER